MKISHHHIWCNYFSRPAEGCKSCERLRRKYPEEGSPAEMMREHFPNVKVRSDPPEEVAALVKGESDD